MVGRIEGAGRECGKTRGGEKISSKEKTNAKQEGEDRGSEVGKS